MVTDCGGDGHKGKRGGKRVAVLCVLPVGVCCGSEGASAPGTVAVATSVSTCWSTSRNTLWCSTTMVGRRRLVQSRFLSRPSAAPSASTTGCGLPSPPPPRLHHPRPPAPTPLSRLTVGHTRRGRGGELPHKGPHSPSAARGGCTPSSPFAPTTPSISFSALPAQVSGPLLPSASHWRSHHLISPRIASRCADSAYCATWEHRLESCASVQCKYPVA